MSGQLYKFLDEDLRSMHGGHGRWTPGCWRWVRGPLQPCRYGLHFVTVAHLPLWAGPTLWLAEAVGKRLTGDDKVVVRRGRITTRVEAWNARTAQLFACDCAERALPIFECACPGDTRPREAVAAARRFAGGMASQEELSRYAGMARAAAGMAMLAVSTIDLWAAGLAARAALRAAEANAAGAAADAAWAASYGGDGANEQEWQARHLADMLGLPWDVA